jgi:transposase
MEISVVGIDIGKTIFHLVGVDQQGAITVKKKLSRTQLLAFLANVPVRLIGMEACSGAHFLARALMAQGHQVRMMPAQYVRPYVKTNKNDFIDAEAIAEAVQRPNMRFVPLKTHEQLDLQAIHRVRERWMSRRTSLINQIRALLLERGITVPRGPENLRQVLPEILADAENSLSGMLRALISDLQDEWKCLELNIERTNEQISNVARTDEACQRVLEVPGIGSLTATALIAAIGNGSEFRKARDLGAWLGLVPRQFSTGGKQRLLGISKSGNNYLRQLFVHGARAVFARMHRDQHAFGPWLTQLDSRKKRSTTIVALANKLARIAWAVLTTGQPYRGTHCSPPLGMNTSMRARKTEPQPAALRA